MKKNIFALSLLITCLSAGSCLQAMMRRGYDGNTYKNEVPETNAKLLKKMKREKEKTSEDKLKEKGYSQSSSTNGPALVRKDDSLKKRKKLK